MKFDSASAAKAVEIQPRYRDGETRDLTRRLMHRLLVELYVDGLVHFGVAQILGFERGDLLFVHECETDIVETF